MIAPGFPMTGSRSRRNHSLLTPERTFWHYAQIVHLFPELSISCPYCGETITVLVDGSVEEQQYIEDCEVCCRPMDITATVRADGSLRVDVRREND